MDTTLSSSASLEIEGAIYETALSLSPAARATFLQKIFHADARGLARMQRLIRQSGESAAFFLEARDHESILADEILAQNLPGESAQTGEPLSSTESPGSRIGPYRLMERIGEGGCGIVYEAEQESPVHRRVALKIIRLGMDTESVIARFEAERQALALMDHPHIARVYDAGATATGRPYFVMERVTGEKITVFCDREKLGLLPRIHLFILVCQGIQHAHQKGIIHRDIKPSNILVTNQEGGPVPKVIDFGIAKAAEGHFDEKMQTLWTSRDQLIGTPPYMSPEQVDMSGTDVDTRSDIYSLGILLHELLGGRTPFDGHVLASAGISKMRQTLLEREPPLLSRMLAELPADDQAKIAADRREDPPRLIAHVRGDLDWILAKAMAKDRDQRYQTVNSFAADLQRFLRDEPVQARRPSRIYLLGKFVRRHRVTCISVTAIALSLIAGLGTSTWLYLREGQALAEQEKLRREAESARATEAHLRLQAQARANVSQAAVLLSEGRLKEADALLQNSPLESVEPSREAAGVFRALGNWNAAYERWEKAVQCYVLLDQANRLDDPASIVEDTDLLVIAPVLRKYGEPGAYEKFRRQTLNHYLPARNALQAEHLLKACLLAPAGADILARLEEAAEVCALNAPIRSGRATFPDWNAFSLTLYYYRAGDWKKTLAYGARSLSYPGSATRISSTLCLTAVAHARQGRMPQAHEDLAQARRLIANAPLAGNSTGDSFEKGTWFSWLIARLLLGEAEREIALEKGR